MNAKTDSERIDLLGGTAKVAAMFGITKASVSEWRKHGIPPARRMYLELVRPDLFDLPPSTAAADDHPREVA